MTLARASRMLGLMALAVIASPFAVAADSGAYIGASVGPSKAHLDQAQTIRNLGLTAGSIAADNREKGFKLFAGYKLDRNFSLEGGYFDLGSYDFTATTVPAGTLIGHFKTKGLNLDLVGFLPITPNFSAFGRAGMQYAETRDSFAGTGAAVVTNPNPTKRGMNYKFGVGLQYDFTDFYGMRVEVERYRITEFLGNKGNVDLLSLGFVYRFERKTPAPVPAARPAAMASPPPPQVVVAPPPPSPPPQEVVTPPPPPQEVVTPPRQKAPARLDRY